MSHDRTPLMDEPHRVRLSRQKGWRMPPNTVKVSRPSKWGNPFVVDPERAKAPEYQDYRKNVDCWTGWPVANAATAVRAYAVMVASHLNGDDLARLRGKNLACWCPLDQPCHADVLLEIANR